MNRMHAVILAAGAGRRMGVAHASAPKCLLQLDGTSLLARQLALLSAAGVRRVTLVSGYQAARVERALRALAATATADVSVAMRFNPEFDKGSVLSCLTAESVLSSGDSVLLMDADVLCDARLIERLLGSAHANCVLVDRALPPDDEAVKLAARDGRPVGFGKRLPADLAGHVVGESVGFFRLAPAMAGELARRCSRYERAGDVQAPYEYPLRDLMLAHAQAFGHEDVSDLPWVEIDFPEDLAYAREQVLPRLEHTAVAP